MTASKVELLLMKILASLLSKLFVSILTHSKAKPMMYLLNSSRFYTRSLLALGLLSSLACIVTTDELAENVGGSGGTGSGGTGAVNNSLSSGGTSSGAADGSAASTGGVAGTGGSTMMSTPDMTDPEEVAGTGGGMSSEEPTTETCTPGEAGFQSENGYVLALDTCVYYQNFSVAVTDLNFAAAIAECTSLMIGGFNDWRLPSLEELDAIVDKTQGLSPSIDSTTFPNTAAKLHWTSLQDETTKKVTTVDFSNIGNVSTNTGADGPQAYRCVRAASL